MKKVYVQTHVSSSENSLTEISIGENPGQYIETERWMPLEEELRKKDLQLKILQAYREEERAKLKKQLRVKRKEVGELEKELNDREQDYIKLQRDLSEAKEQLSKCDSLLTTREVLGRGELREGF